MGGVTVLFVLVQKELKMGKILNKRTKIGLEQKLEAKRQQM